MDESSRAGEVKLVDVWREGGIDRERKEDEMQECTRNGWPAQKSGERKAMAEQLTAKRKEMYTQRPRERIQPSG